MERQCRIYIKHATHTIGRNDCRASARYDSVLILRLSTIVLSLFFEYGLRPYSFIFTLYLFEIGLHVFEIRFNVF